MKFIKLFWAFRGLILKPFMGHFGSLSYIGKPTSIIGYKNIYIGNRVRIQPGVRMETSNGGKIIIKDNTSIGQNVHITADSEPLIIGENNTILGNSFITNIDHDYSVIGIPILQQKYIVKTTAIDSNCFIGYGSCIQAGTKLGKQCIVGANAVVRGEYQEYSVIVGVPAKVIKRYDNDTKQWIRINK